MQMTPAERDAEIEILLTQQIDRKPVCKNCMFRRGIVCCRFPPVGGLGNPFSDRGHPVFPGVGDDDWCGEHQFEHMKLSDGTHLECAIRNRTAEQSGVIGALFEKMRREVL